VLVFSATYPHDLDATLCEYMRDPALIRVLGEDSDVQLLGIKQYAVFSPNTGKGSALSKLLRGVQFTQCIIFRNDLEK
jgi:superfamily II DNA/RNA helicase